MTYDVRVREQSAQPIVSIRFGIWAANPVIPCARMRKRVVSPVTLV